MTKLTALLQQLQTKIEAKLAKKQQGWLSAEDLTYRGTARKEASSSSLLPNMLRQETEMVWHRLKLACDQITQILERPSQHNTVAQNGQGK